MNLTAFHACIAGGYTYTPLKREIANQFADTPEEAAMWCDHPPSQFTIFRRYVRVTVPGKFSQSVIDAALHKVKTDILSMRKGTSAVEGCNLQFLFTFNGTTSTEDMDKTTQKIEELLGDCLQVAIRAR